MTIQTLFAVFVGGGLGSVTRLLVSGWVLKLSNSQFPWGTISANLLACLVMGLVFTSFDKGIIRQEGWMAFLIFGFCGGFSTFSTFSLETLRLLREGMYLFAGANVVLSVLACLLILYFLVK
jgi:CrcB protein